MSTCKFYINIYIITYFSWQFLSFAVTDKFGSNTPKTEIFVLAPASARPVLVERYSGKLNMVVKCVLVFSCIEFSSWNMKKVSSFLQ